MKTIGKQDFHYNFYKDATQAEKKLNIILGFITDVFFEYDIVNDTIQFNNKNINNSQMGVEKDYKEYIISSKNMVEEDKSKFLDFLNTPNESAVEFRYIDDDGKIIWCLARGCVLLDEEGKPCALIGCISNIDEQKCKNEQLLQQARIDQLTKLYNKEYTQSAISQYLSAEGVDGIHALLIVDIDNFKEVNDNLGYLFGDTVLTNIADKLHKLFYSTDIVGRIGGDEFLVLIKDTDDKKILQDKMNAISRLFSDTYAGENTKHKISCSIGIAQYPVDGTDYITLFKNADKALYRSQNSGNNQYQFYEKEDSVDICCERDYAGHYQVDSHRSYQYSDFDKEITAFAFDIMSKTKDVNSAIYMLLGKVGKHFSVEHVSILENSDNDQHLNATYQWNAEREHSEFDTFTVFHYEKFPDYRNLFNEHGILQIADSSRLTKLQSSVTDIMNQLSLKALLQCAIYENGKFVGCVSVDECSQPRNWTKSEVDSLLTITKIISSYLLKLRTSEKVKARLEKIKNYDDLTGLPTLHKFKKNVRRLLEQNPSEQYAIVYSDISNFKYINDIFGYETGDRILCDYAEKINSGEWKGEAIARVSADNFVMVLKCESEVQLIYQIEHINRVFGRLQKNQNINFNIVVTSGACLINSKEDIMLAIDNANIARKSAKGCSKTICRFYSSEMSDRINKEVEIANSMEEALKNGEFNVYLQPKVCLEDGKLVGAEALVRWIKTDGTIMPPIEFIPTFEKNGFVVNLDFFIYEQVCIMIKRWMDCGMEAVPISVNVSRVHLNNDNFVKKIKRLVDTYQVPPELLELELTESIFLNNTKVALDTMHELRNLGFGVSIDDFGAGYSSLNLLKDMETDVLKLDKEFFRQGDMKREEKIIVGSIISMAKQLNMKVLSEGVETQMQSEFLRDMSCDMAQGYLYAKPMPIKEFESLIITKFFPSKHTYIDEFDKLLNNKIIDKKQVPAE